MVRRLRAIVLSLLLVPLAASAGGPKKHAGRRIVVALDAGHGGVKTGAVGVHHLLEKNVTRAIVARIARRLRKRGYIVRLTRRGDADVDLRERVRRANAWHADVFVSIHCNAVAGRHARRISRGIETYFLAADATDRAAQHLADEENAAGGSVRSSRADPLAAILRDLTVSASQADSSRLADRVQRSLVRLMHWHDRGVKQAPFAVLDGARMPAILVEVGFITNPYEGRELAKARSRARLAHAVARGIVQFLGDVASRGVVASRRRAPITLAGR